MKQLDIASIKKLDHDNWYNGVEGFAYDLELLLKFKKVFDENYKSTLDNHYTYPTADKNVILIEWEFKHIAPSLEVNLETGDCLYYFVGFSESKVFTIPFNVYEDSDFWIILNFEVFRNENIEKMIDNII